MDRISDRSALHDLLIESGAPTVQVVEERGEHVLESPEDWWRMVLGSGLRGAVERLTDVERERVRRDNIDCIAAAGIRGVRVDTVYGIARKH